MYLTKLAIATTVVVASLGIADSVAIGQDDDLRLVLEQPFYRAEIGQISEIRGWALHPTEQIDTIEIYIDNQFYSIVPVGGQRGDVYNAYPDAVSSRYSGYAQTVNFKTLPPGFHTMQVVAYTVEGSYNAITSEFCVDGFTGEFISDSSSINLQTVARLHTDKNALILEGMEVDGYLYNVELVWNKATQGFIIEQTTPYEYINGDYSKHCRVCAPDM
tara:strand:- start:113418 stop:114068 length:651 start_codon:yes stop_codon:yes gene_type:complete